MSDFHFLRPLYLYLFIPFLLVFWVLLHRTQQKSIWNQVCSKDLLPYVIVGKQKKNFLSYLALLIGTLLICATAGPAWDKTEHSLLKKQSGLIIALDLSAAMNAADIKPSRLQASLYKLTDLLNARTEGQTALIVFSGDAFVVTPLTDDTAMIKSLLQALQTNIMPTGGHRIDLAVAKGIELLEQGGCHQGSVLLITPECSLKERDKAIDIASKSGIAISVLAVGTEEGAPVMHSDGGFTKDQKGAMIVSKLAKENLHQLASATQGHYCPISIDDQDVQSLIAGFSSEKAVDQMGEMKLNQWHDMGYWLVLLALPFMLVFYRKGVLLLLPFFLAPTCLHAEFLKTPDQQGQKLFSEEKWQEASAHFEHTDWKAASYYRLGDYQKAADLFTDPYNKGNAFAKLGDFEKALACYEQALELDPDNEDAAFNKKLIEEQQKQQQEQEQDQDKKDQDEKKQDEQKQEQKQDKDQEKEPQDKENQDDTADQQNELDEQQKKEMQNQMDKELEGQNEDKDKDQDQDKDHAGNQDDPQQQTDDRWLQKIEDDPGGLLRRKFLQQYKERAYKN
ncbi:MAG: tetratricopeptide repeat protein [Chlamydiales bacterium]|nr:tetratricopeptide repeat protein [Chlamydiales bacterium]